MNLLDTTLEKFMGKLSDEMKSQLSQRYTNHCIRVSGTTNLSKIYNPKQVMSVTGHKSLQSLSIYQRVHADEKMCMGISLTYSLLNPEETKRIRNTPEYKTIMFQEKQGFVNQTPALPPPVPTSPRVVEARPEVHALDTANMNIWPLEGALQPYVQAPKQATPEGSPSFDIMQLMSDLEGDNDIILAASQFEENQQVTTTKTAVVKKSSPRVSVMPTFSGCKFGNINTLNIHIHKN